MTASPGARRAVTGQADSHDQRFSAAAVRAAYDSAAADYTVAFADDLARLPIDRAMLDAAVARLPDNRLALDLGCGPAPAGAYLGAKGVTAIGADLSARMLTAARNRNPSVAVVQADMRRLPFRPGAVGAVVAYYSIQHLPRADLAGALAEVGRVLASDGVLLVATHLGDGDVFIDEFLGHRIDPVGAALYERAELVGRLHAAGFDIDVERQRGPLPHEADTRRIYLLARRHPR